MILSSGAEYYFSPPTFQKHCGFGPT